MIEIRDITEADSEAFSALIIQLAEESEYTLLTPDEARQAASSQGDRTRQLIASPNHTVLLALEDDQLLGFIGLTRGTLQKNAHVCSRTIGVVQAQQNRGIGSRLLDHGLSWAKSQEIQRIELGVMPDNVHALKLYRKYGFNIEGTKKSAIQLTNSFADELIMARILDK